MSSSEKIARSERIPSHKSQCAGESGKIASRSALCSWIALALSCVALALAVFYGPLASGSRKTASISGSSLTDDGLKKYDLSSPESSLRAFWTMEKDADLRALIETQALRSPAKQKLASLKVEKLVPFNNKAILLISYNEEGKDRYSYESFAQDKDTGFWLPSFVSTMEIDRADGKLADEIRTWQMKETEARNTGAAETLQMSKAPAQTKTIR
jgi:hypothetical protein